MHRAKKRKMPLSHGEEIEIDVSTMEYVVTSICVWPSC